MDPLDAKLGSRKDRISETLHFFFLLFSVPSTMAFENSFLATKIIATRGEPICPTCIKKMAYIGMIR
jgi:uncharacterized membrane protein (DUF485 family)